MMLRSAFLNLSAVALFAATAAPVQAQSPVDIGLRSTGDALEVVLRPGNDFSGIVSSVVFTIRWDRSSGASLGEPIQEGNPANYIPVQHSGGVREVGSYDYQVYAGFGTRPMHTLSTAWTASKEYVIATIPVTGVADFELVNDAWTAEATSNADYYLALGGVDRTGIIYKGLANASGDGNVTILPNPNKGIFTFAVDVDKAVDLTVEVVNSLGQSIFTDEVTNFSGTYRRDMDITSMSSGVYILKVGRGDTVTSHKIVYNK